MTIGTLDTAIAMQINHVKDLQLIPHLYKITESFAAALRLSLFQEIGRKRCTLDDLIARLGCNREYLLSILQILVLVGLLKYDGHTYANTEVSRRFLTDEYGGNLVSTLLYASNRAFTRELVIDSVSEGTVHKRLPIGLQLYMDAMAVGNRYAALMLVRRLRALKPKRILDLGCGPGTMAIVLCDHYRDLKVDCIDFENVVRITRPNVIDSGFQDRIYIQAGNFLSNRFPSEHYDGIVLSNVLHLMSRTDGLVTLKKCFRALRQGGSIMVVETFIDTHDLMRSLVSLDWLSVGSLISELESFVAVLKRIGFVALSNEEIRGTSLHLVSGFKDEIESATSA